MIAGWLLYCVAVSMLLGAGAALLDALLTTHGRPARWVWACAIAATLLVPTGAYLMQQRAPRPLPGAGEAGVKSLIDRTPVRAATQVTRSTLGAPAINSTSRRAIPSGLRMPEWSSLDGFVVDLATLCILIAALRVAVDSVVLYRSRRRWSTAVVDDVPVLLSDDFGPAIVGLWKPTVVLPRWTLALDASDRSLMLAHEVEHLRAGDGQITTVALLSVMCMPWSPVLWWLLRRLRTAIEIDCDRRVLSAFPDVARYGRLLVDVAEHANGTPFAVAGFSERAMPIARRIRAMTTSVQRRLSPRSTGLAALGLVVAGGSLVVLPPEAPARSLPAYARQTPILAKNVGDSIALIDDPATVGIATNLPSVFTVVENPNMSTDNLPSTARCAQRLRDDRDGTNLLLRMSTISTISVIQRADTSWTNNASVGYFGVDPVGRYGVAVGHTLRVGCGTFTRVSVGGQDVNLPPVADLATHDDARARNIAREMSALLHLEPDAVELRGGRLDVLVTDSIAAATPNADVDWTRVRGTSAIARSILGQAAMAETLAFTVRGGRWLKRTFYYYESMRR